jgi:putative adhesin
MPMMKTRKRLSVFLGLLIAAVYLLAAGAAGAETLTEKLDRTVPLQAGSQVRLSNVNGAVTLEAWDRNEVRIEAEKKVKSGDADVARKYMSQLKINITQEAGGLRIDTQYPRRQGGGFFDWMFGKDVNANVTYRLHVPRRAALSIASVNGGVSVTGTRGKAHLETVNGGIKVQNVQGNMALETVNGGIDVIRSAGALRAESVNGGIDAELSDLPDNSELRLTSTNGGIHLRLPRDARLSIDAGTTNGRVRSDLPIDGGQPGKRSLQGDLNGGGGKLYARTTNGSIDINGL